MLDLHCCALMPTSCLLGAHIITLGPCSCTFDLHPALHWRTPSTYWQCPLQASQSLPWLLAGGIQTGAARVRLLVVAVTATQRSACRQAPVSWMHASLESVFPACLLPVPGLERSHRRFLLVLSLHAPADIHLRLFYIPMACTHSLAVKVLAFAAAFGVGGHSRLECTAFLRAKTPLGKTLLLCSFLAAL